MTTAPRSILPRMGAADLAAQPHSVIRLVEHLDGVAGTDEYPLSNVPIGLRSADVLRVAMNQGLLRIVVRCEARISTATQTIGITYAWVDFRSAGYPDDLDRAMVEDESAANSTKHLHVRLTPATRDACTERRLRMQERPTPADGMTLQIASKKYHITPKGLREAIHAGRLQDYRAPSTAKNAPMIVSEADVAQRWPKRDAIAV